MVVYSPYSIYDPEYAQEYRLKNKEKIKAYGKEYYQKNKEKIAQRRKLKKGPKKERVVLSPEEKAARKQKRNEWDRANSFKICLHRYYKMTVEDWTQLFETQEKRCAICGTEEPSVRWHTDHCHDTNKVRGILCNKCNSGLGFFDDNPETIAKAVDYLKRFK